MSTKIAYNQIENMVVNVKDFGAVGNGSDDDILAFEAAELEARTNNGFIHIPAGRYYISRPFRFYSGIAGITGDGPDKSVIVKTSEASVQLDVTYSTKAAITSNGAYRFKIEGIGTEGNKTAIQDGPVTATTTGMYLYNCWDCNISWIRNYKHVYGLELNTCWQVHIESAVSQLCTSYGYNFVKACTSSNMINAGAWGCGGGWQLNGVSYTTFVNCIYDYGDRGGNPADEFLSIGGSGGDYLNPNYIYNVSASQGITIISQGAEHTNSQVMFLEGALVSLISPKLYNVQNEAASYTAFELRGVGRSELDIINPWFTGCTNNVTPTASIKGVFIETPATQFVKCNTFLPIDSSFGPLSYSAAGLEFSYAEDLVRMDQTNMHIGGTNPLIPDATGSIVIADVSGVKTAQFANVTDDTYFVVPLPRKGVIKVDTEGTFTSAFDVFRMKVREVGGADLKEWTSISTNEYYTIDSGVDVEFAIRKFKAADTLEMSKLVVQHIK
jgi:hypothetical protein